MSLPLVQVFKSVPLSLNGPAWRTSLATSYATETMNGITTTTDPHQRTVRFTLVRHGQTEGNVQGIAVGQETSPLTELGKEQARALGRHPWFRGNLANVGRVYTSDLHRAQNTAALALEATTTTTPNSKQQYLVDARLRELARGARQTYPKAWSYEQAAKDRAQKGLEEPLLESDDDGWQRLTDWLVDVWRDNSTTPVPVHDSGHHHLLAFGHAGLWRVLIRRILRDDRLKEHPRAEYDPDGRFRIPNTSVTVFDLTWNGQAEQLKDAKATVIKLTWTGHYEDEALKKHGFLVDSSNYSDE